MIRVTAGILVREGRVLVCQRRTTAAFPLRWEFPGGKLDPGETPRRALVRELAEELGIGVRTEDLDPVERIRHRYPEGPEVEIHFFRVRAFEGEPVNLAFEAMVWTEAARLVSFDFLDADRPLVARLARGGAPPSSGLRAPNRRGSVSGPAPED